MIRYFQFSLKTLLWLMVVAAAFCVGIATGRRLEQSQLEAALEGESDARFIDYPEYPDPHLWDSRTNGVPKKPSAH
ncbi:MAG TPA: hypothetical protein VG125_02730 [Pirellulales bacterium]|jgi:hypothetical protein|nr:hypothetical protein [Pirellulales bacterium]